MHDDDPTTLGRLLLVCTLAGAAGWALALGAVVGAVALTRWVVGGC